MSTVDRSRVELLHREYERQRAGLAELRRRLSGLEVTVVSARREVAVTVGNQGVVTDLKFPTDAYRRLARNELANLVLRTIAEAREKVIDETAEIMTPLLPRELDAKALLTGEFTVEEFAPEEPMLPPMVRERMDRSTS